ncbi:MAG: hypothetical protein J6Q68_00325 [Clostridia bacterium]|nr:hypothetical protein [Clostridia bacterium]
MKATERILGGDIDNRLYPFFWLTGPETLEDIEAAMVRLKEAGCMGICVESRDFPDFEVAWWEKIDFIMPTAERLGMKVWIVDEDTRCPCGHVFGLAAKGGDMKLRRENLVEMHADVVGPCKKDFVVAYTNYRRASENKDKLIGAFMYKRTDSEQGIDISSAVEVTDKIKNGILRVDVPEGAHRIFYVYRTHKYTEFNNDDFIDFINRDAVKLLVDNLYEEYKRRYGKFFGKTFVGFFSDEPSIGSNYYFNASLGAKSGYDRRIGTPGQTLPWSDELSENLDKMMGTDARYMLPALWFYGGEISHSLRENYMDILSDLYRKNFVMQVGEWCKNNGMLYTGHVLEDNNLHTRYGNGPGHYFRSQEGQTMPGFDIVLHQLIPDHADCDYNGSASFQMNSAFYHYVLAKLTSSAAHTYEAFGGKALGEITIGYGWAEGTRLAKWLYDYCLVRGINHFVNGAIAPHFRDDMHPPHFGARDNREPQELGAAKLFGYLNRATMLLEGAHIANAAILYNARTEWSNFDGEYQLVEKPAKALYDCHIDFDIFSEDLLDKAEVKDGKITIVKEKFDCLVVPYAKYLSPDMQGKLVSLINRGADVVFVDGIPDNAEYEFSSVSLSSLAKYFFDKGYYDIRMAENHRVRHIHFKNGENDVYMFSNESTLAAETVEAQLKNKGNCNIYDLLGNAQYSYNCDGTLKLELAPYQSYIVVFEEDRGFDSYEKLLNLNEKELKCKFDVALYDSENMGEGKTSFTMEELTPISAEYPDFSGKIEYRTNIGRIDAEKAFLEFENIGENAELFVNGKSCGIRICPPYRFDVTGAVSGENNEILLNVYTTLANSVKDPVSMFTALEPTGAFGKLVLKTI